MARQQQQDANADLYREDLNPHDRAGESDLPNPVTLRSAYDIKDLHASLDDIPDDILKRIPVLDTGTRLQEGATYIDLRHPERGVINGMNNLEAGPDNAYVMKTEVDYELWNLLTGVRDPARLGRFAEDIQP